MSLIVALRHTQGSFELDLAFESTGPLTAIFGASGSGKTTLVNAIAGLITPRHARIIVGGTVLTDTDAGIAVPPHRRRMATCSRTHGCFRI